MHYDKDEQVLQLSLQDSHLSFTLKKPMAGQLVQTPAALQVKQSPELLHAVQVPLSM